MKAFRACAEGELPGRTRTERPQDAGSRATSWRRRVMMGVALCLVAVGPAVADEPYARVVVYYDNLYSGSQGILCANLACDLLSHFRTVCTPTNVDAYAAGSLTNYDVAVYLGVDHREWNDHPLPAAFVADMAAATLPVVWINENIGFLLEATNRFGLTCLGETGGYDRVTYKGEWLFKSSNYLEVVGLQWTNPAVPLAWASSSQQPALPQYPYALRSSNLWYVADNCFFYETYADRTLVVADLLHDVLGAGTGVCHRALVRLEDLNPYSSAMADATAIAQALSEIGVPLGCGVIPRFRNATNAQDIVDVPMTTNRTFQRRLRTMVRAGAGLAAHGYTHESGDAASANGYEFSNSSGEPLPYDSWAWCAGRVEASAAELLRCGYPVRVWETPHYTASLLDYHVFASRYGAFFERVQVFDVFTQGLAVPELEALSATDPDSSSPARPYALHSAMYGNVCLPENLGYYSPGRVDGNGLNMTEATKVLYAQKHLVVRDSIVCFYYHPYRGVGPATNMVHQIRGLGYTYVAPESLYWDEPVSVAGNADSNAAETVRLMSGVVSNLAAHVAIGDAGSSNRLELQSGAVLSNPSAVIGARVGSGGNLGRVADTGSLWSLDRRLAVGRGGSDNALIVTNGAVVASRDAVVGQEASALRNTAVVTGAGSHWTNRYGLVVGLEGSSNRVEVAGGGRITATYVELAGATNACGNSLVVWGAGSRLECRGHVAAGVSGPGNCIQVGEGARVESAAAFVGVESGAAGNAVRVEGAGTCWSNRHVLAVGVDSLGNCMSITTGATVWCAGAVVGDYDGSRDNRLEVAGSNTLLAVAGDVRVGRDGRSNTLWVADGAGVWCTNAVIGEYWSATNNAATARGPGARWIVEGPLVVGQDGVNSRLLVTNGGTVQAASLAVNAASATGGAVVVAGGALVLTNGVGPAALSLARGATLDVQEGVLQAGRVTIPSGCRMTLGTGTVLQGAGVITNEGLLSVAAAMDFPLSLVVSGNGLLTGAASNAWGVGGDFVCTSTNPGLELARTAFTCRSGAVHRVAISSANWSNSLRGFYRNRSLGRLDVHGTVDVVNVCYVWRLSGDGLLRVGSGSRLYYLSADGWSGALELSGDGVCEQVPLEVTQLTRLTQGGMRVDWTSCSGLSFRVEWADGPAGAYAAATNLPGTGNTNAWTDGGGQGRTHPSNAAMRLYRITAFP